MGQQINLGVDLPLTSLGGVAGQLTDWVTCGNLGFGDGGGSLKAFGGLLNGRRCTFSKVQGATYRRCIRLMARSTGARSIPTTRSCNTEEIGLQNDWQQVSSQSPLPPHYCTIG